MDHLTEEEINRAVKDQTISKIKLAQKNIGLAMWASVSEGVTEVLHLLNDLYEHTEDVLDYLDS